MLIAIIIIVVILLIAAVVVLLIYSKSPILPQVSIIPSAVNPDVVLKNSTPTSPSNYEQYFNEHKNMKCEYGRHLSSVFQSGISLNECSRECYEDPTCLSFEHYDRKGECNLFLNCSPEFIEPDYQKNFYIKKSATRVTVETPTGPIRDSSGDLSYLPHYNEHPGAECTGLNDLGVYSTPDYPSTHKTKEQCAELCYNKPDCASFEYGRYSGHYGGKCWLSSSCLEPNFWGDSDLYVKKSALIDYEF